MLRETVFVGLLAVFLGPHLYERSRKLPVYDRSHPWFQLTDIWTDKELDNLRDLMKSQEVFRTQAEEITSGKTLEVKERVKPDGVCPHPFLVKQRDSDYCILPSRIDMFLHYAKTGGRYGAKDKLLQLVNNVQSFQSYLFHMDMPELQTIFNSDQYVKAAKNVCGKDHPVYERVQVNLIIMLPGQDLPMHFDLPWFRDGGNRFNLPQWLLVAMAGSGLWEQDLLPQVQGVAYLHMNKTIDGGSFFLYPNGPGAEVVDVASNANTGIVLNGIQVIHGAQRFHPSSGRPAPDIRKDPAEMRYNADTDTWRVTSDRGDFLGEYRTHDLRMTLVWRSICFKSEEDKGNWDPKNVKVDPEEILQKLEDDLRKKGVLAKDQPRPEMLEFAQMLTTEYVQYPVDNFHSAWFPYNYCMLPYATTNKFLRDVLLKVVDFVC